MHRSAICLLILFSSLVTLVSGKRKLPPVNWDQKPCQALEEMGHGCRQCTAKDQGFGNSYQQGLARALSHTSTAAQPAWLRIAIGTIPRKSDQPYLERVLNSIADELPHWMKGFSIESMPPIGRIEVLVVNFRPNTHAVFDRVRDTFTHPLHPAREHFTFVEIDPVRCDPPIPSNWEYKKGLSPEVSPRQQTRDVVSLYKAVGQKKCQHALIVEDDFELCPGGLHLIKHAISKASKGGWSGLRVGVAGNGIVLPCNDIEPITKYLLDHQYMMPVDLLLPEWFIRIHTRAKSYLHASSVFRINDKNLFNHIGLVSSFNDGRGVRRTSMCGDVLKSKTWMSGESFDPKCKKYGLSPCSSAHMKINSVDLKYHSGSHRSSVAGHIQVLRGNVGESCDVVCSQGKHRHGDRLLPALQKKGLTCGGGADFLSINNCRYLRRHFNKCRGGCLKLQTVVAQNSIGGVAKHVFGGLSPGSVMGGGGNGGLCWHRQSHKPHMMVRHFDQPSECRLKHRNVARLCPCVDISLKGKRK